MAATINEYDRYDISGKIIDISDYIFTISVTSPFTCVIEFHCDSYQYDNILHPLPFKYNWMGLREGHPSGVMAAAAYYNIEEKRFYKKESGRASVLPTVFWATP